MTAYPGNIVKIRKSCNKSPWFTFGCDVTIDLQIKSSFLFLFPGHFPNYGLYGEAPSLVRGTYYRPQGGESVISG